MLRLADMNTIRKLKEREKRRQRLRKQIGKRTEEATAERVTASEVKEFRQTRLDDWLSGANFLDTISYYM